MISTHNSSDNVNSGVPNKEGIIDRWHRCKFRTVKISVFQNQCLQFCLNAFYNDVDNLKKATLLWSCAYWGKEQISRLNDNAFVFNRMLGYNTAIFDEVDNKWQHDRVNDQAETCYIKYKDKHFTYLQPVANIEDIDFDVILPHHTIIEEANVYTSSEILEGIYKNIIPLYSLVMSKFHSLITLVGIDDVRVSEFKMKTEQYPNLPILQVNYFTPSSQMIFPITSRGYQTFFALKRLHDDTKFQLIIDNLYPLLSIEELKAMKVTEQNVLLIEESIFLAMCSSCNEEINKGDVLIVCATADCTFKILFNYVSSMLGSGNNILLIFC